MLYRYQQAASTLVLLLRNALLVLRALCGPNSSASVVGGILPAAVQLEGMVSFSHVDMAYGTLPTSVTVAPTTTTEIVENLVTCY